MKKPIYSLVKIFLLCSICIICPLDAYGQNCNLFQVVPIGSGICDDNGTVNDPSDDTFIHTVYISNDNNPGGTWTSNDATIPSGNYVGGFFNFGPYLT